MDMFSSETQTQFVVVVAVAAVVVVVALISFNRDVFASTTLLIRAETSGFRHSRREIGQESCGFCRILRKSSEKYKIR